MEPDPRPTTMAPVSLDPAERFGFVRLRSPLARAVVPVVAGAAAIALILLATWGIAALMTGGRAELTERLAPSTFRVGDVEDVADEIDEDGPLLLAGLNTTTGERTLVLDHVGDDPTRGWRTYWAYPADRDASCAVDPGRGDRPVHRLRGPPPRRVRPRSTRRRASGRPGPARPVPRPARRDHSHHNLRGFDPPGGLLSPPMLGRGGATASPPRARAAVVALLARGHAGPEPVGARLARRRRCG